MTKNAESIEFLDYFCDEKNTFDYAVLIDAPWGSGKTTFLKNYLKNKYPVSSATSDEPPAYIWVSLFGRTSVSEIRDALFAEAHPLLTSKWSMLAGSVASALLKKATGFDSSDRKLTEQFLPDITAKLVVFDDLERTTVDVSTTLGLINSFIENSAFKVIVISNQKPLIEEADYRSQKEKVIGRTLTVISDPDAVLSELTKGIRNDAAREAVSTNREAIISVFNASGYHNIRSLRAALDDFDRLVEKSDSRLAGSPAALRELITYLVAVGMEIRADAIRVEKLEQFLNAAISLGFGGNPVPQESDARTLTRKYPMVNWTNPIIKPGILGRLITSGILPLQDINDLLNVHPLIVGATKSPTWLSLWSWMSLDATDYQDSREALRNELDAKSIQHPGQILHVLGILIVLDEFGDKLEPNLESFFLSYIDTLKEERKLEPNTSVFDKLHSDSWAGFTYQKSDHPTFKKIWSHLQKAVSDVHTLAMKDEAKSLLDRLQIPGTENQLYERDENSGKFGGVALLQNIPVSDFADLLLKNLQYNRQLIEALYQRYESGRGYPDLIEEKGWLIDLELELRKRAVNAPAPFGRLMDVRTDYFFNGIHENMKNIEAAKTGR